MNDVDPPPDLEELIGVASVASVLVIDPEVNETPLLRIAALGAAARTVASTQDLATPRAQPGERDRIEADLAPLLWRLKGGRAGELDALQAVQLFARWMVGTRSWQESPPDKAFGRRFAALVIREWLSDRCPACNGAGLQELLRNGQTRKPQRFNDRSVRHVPCRACHGSARARPSAAERAHVLELSLAEVKATWGLRLDKAQEHLRFISRRLHRPLRFQLERDTNRA